MLSIFISITNSFAYKSHSLTLRNLKTSQLMVLQRTGQPVCGDIDHG